MIVYLDIYASFLITYVSVLIQELGLILPSSGRSDQILTLKQPATIFPTPPSSAESKIY